MQSMHVVIIGNGISGITAARFIRKLSDHKITVVSAETEHFFSRTALMYVYMGHMQFEDIKPYEDWFWSKNRIELCKAYVQSINAKLKKVVLDNGELLTYDKLVIATGSESNKFGWPGQDLNRVHGLYHLQDLEAMERHSHGLRRAVVVGGGLIGIEMAEMFHSRNIPVTFLVREESYWDIVLPPEESQMINRHILENHIDLRLKTELEEIVDDGNGNACAVITKSGERIDCGFVGLTAGVHPNIGFLEGSGVETQRGILVDKHLQTNIPDIYAIGDCAQHREPRKGRRNIEAVWYTGRMTGETVAHVICGNAVEYDPGIWFNSAKFFDIEYQVYGDVQSSPPDNHRSVYWEHPQGRASIRIIYDTATSAVIGFNLMGVRYRQEICEKWIRDQAHIESVLRNLGLANFDPEFYKQYEHEVVRIYNQQTGKQISLKQKRSLTNAIKFLRSKSKATQI